jgi:DNA anti-recombination protein RmuC
VQNHLVSGAERFQKQVLEAGIRLERRSEEFLRALHQRLSEEHDMYRQEMQKVQAAVGSESSRLQAQNADLATRMAKLNESARQLESDLDSRLVQMGSDIISGARTQLERALDVVLKELGTRNSQELGKQLDDACEHLKSVQKGIEGSISQLLKTEVTGTLLSFGQTMEELAQDSVGRWRHALAQDLSSLAKTLGGQFRLDGTSE